MARTAAVPRVGILVECGPEGLEIHLCSRICALLRDNHGAAFTELIQPMDNKERLLEEGATTAARLMDEGCERVVVLWDEELHPVARARTQTAPATTTAPFRPAGIDLRRRTRSPGLGAVPIAALGHVGLQPSIT